MTNKKDSKRGRPKLADTEKRSIITQIRYTPLERKQLERADEVDSKKLSDWIRAQAIQDTNSA